MLKRWLRDAIMRCWITKLSRKSSFSCAIHVLIRVCIQDTRNSIKPSFGQGHCYYDSSRFKATRSRQ